MKTNTPQQTDLTLSNIVEAIIDTVAHVNDIHQKVEHMRELLMEQYRSIGCSGEKEPLFYDGGLEK